MTLKIYADRMSQPSRAIILFCKLNGIEFEEIKIDISKRQHLLPEFKEINPMRQLPAIVHGTFKLSESHAILSYLACAFPGVSDHWYPADLFNRAEINSVLDWHHSNLRRGAAPFVLNSVLAPALGLPLNPQAAAEAEKILSSSLSKIESIWLKGNGEFLLGSNQPSIADLSLVCEIMQLEISTFKYQLKEFGSSNAKKAVYEYSADRWWSSYGEDTPELQKIAIRILSQTCSASGCERNWSTFSLIHTKTRNRLSSEKLDHLVFVHYNMRLRVRNFKRDKESDYKPIDLDYLFEDDNPLNAWLSEKEAPVLDGQPNSWLDEELGGRYDGENLSTSRLKRRFVTQSMIMSDDEDDNDSLNEPEINSGGDEIEEETNDDHFTISDDRRGSAEEDGHTTYDVGRVPTDGYSMGNWSDDLHSRVNNEGRPVGPYGPSFMPYRQTSGWAYGPFTAQLGAVGHQTFHCHPYSQPPVYGNTTPIIPSRDDVQVPQRSDAFLRHIDTGPLDTPPDDNGES